MGTGSGGGAELVGGSAGAGNLHTREELEASVWKPVEADHYRLECLARPRSPG